MAVNALISELAAIATAWEQAAAKLARPKLVAKLEKLRESAKPAGLAFSGSWIGYHATTYMRDLRRRRPDEVFSADWGLPLRVEEMASYDKNAMMLAEQARHVQKFLERRAALTLQTKNCTGTT